jgi:bifunctional non-homologous end joining protein LigD
VPLDEYRRKRDFAKTPEPAPGDVTARPADGVSASPADPAAPAVPPFALRRRFVVGRHRATRLHYDLRLEIGGVLVSWAVPKGPSLDPAAKRMAVHVEDHPHDYFDFEGAIPKGEYGAGDAIVWDWGYWEPERETPDPEQALIDGELKFRLRGEKLRGRWTIVRTGEATRKAGSAAKKGEPGNLEATGDPWLLIAKQGPDAVEGWDAEDHPQSVKTGRTNDEVTAGDPPKHPASPPAQGVDPDLALAVPSPLPRFIEPMLATPGTAVPPGPEWLIEVKWDGYRTQALVRAGHADLRSRGGNDAAAWFPRLNGAADWIEAQDAVIDGEVVALDEQGRPDFSLLQERMHDAKGGLVFIAFDLLHLDGHSLLNVPLEARKALLATRVRPDPRVQVSQHVVGGGPAFFEAAVKHGLEGVVAKRRRSTYQPGRRSADWIKRKGRPSQDLVVGGWTPEQGGKGLGALLVGVYEDGKLRFSGAVGSGFDGTTRRLLLDRLAALEADAPAFDPPPAPNTRNRWTGKELAGVRWVRPELVISAEMAGWTRDGNVRQAAFKGIQDDRDPNGVTREAAIEVATPDEASAASLSAAISATSAADSASAASASGSSASAPGPSIAYAGASKDELAALAAMGKEGVWHVGGRELKLTNLDKPLFPPRDGSDEPPVSKRELIAYFGQVAPAMLPHLAGRPLNLHRYPDGAGKPGFWQKQIPATAPDWLTRWRETGLEGREDREANDHLVADGAAALCWLGNQASFEVHAWTSTCEDPWQPTYALIDIDPGTQTTWDQTLALARLYRTALAHLGVRAYPKVTGGRGLHAWIPIERGRYSYDETSAWVEKLSRAVGSAMPELVSWEWSKKDRGGKARLDYTQNQPIKTLVAPYAVRPAPGAPVSAPITWDELDDPELRPDRWTVRTLLPRLAELGDLWAPLPRDAQVLPPL